LGDVCNRAIIVQALRIGGVQAFLSEAEAANKAHANAYFQ
jgi:hypothetical protein